jgi:hypothetical protein
MFGINMSFVYYQYRQQHHHSQSALKIIKSVVFKNIQDYAFKCENLVNILIISVF